MTAVATTKGRHPIVQLMESEDAKAKIMALLPEGQSFERVMQEFYLAAADNPDILQCEPASIVRAVSRAVSWDLVIGTTSFLVPRKGKLCAQQGYRGKIELMVRNRAVRLIDAQAVYANEHFRPQYGTNPSIEHTPIMDPKGRGALIGAYAYAKLSAYEFKIVVISAEEVDEIRQKYSHQWKSGKLDTIPWYALKTAINRLAKQIPMSPKLAKLLADDDEEADISDMVEEPLIAPGSREERKILNAGPVPHPDEMLDEREPGDEDHKRTPFDE